MCLGEAQPIARLTATVIWVPTKDWRWARRLPARHQGKSKGTSCTMTPASVQAQAPKDTLRGTIVSQRPNLSSRRSHSGGSENDGP
jgi:hypothetical protein